MKSTAGLWIDHRKAIIAIVSAEGERTVEIISGVERQPEHLEGVSSAARGESQKVQAGDRRDRNFAGHLKQYYDDVIAAVHDAGWILIFGPGEAKGELKKRLDRARLGAHIAIETADKMTGRQIRAKVRAYSQESDLMTSLGR